ncbi:hypothetical protein G4S02_004894 [Salmonella enterica]|nr:hypothetical protein [Salmonella enterica]
MKRYLRAVEAGAVRPFTHVRNPCVPRAVLTTIVLLTMALHTPNSFGEDKLTIQYGASKKTDVIVRVFYIISPSTTLNDVAIGEISYRYTDTIGTGRSKIGGPYEITKHTLLPTCSRDIISGKISTSCFNKSTGNAIACRGLVDYSSSWKDGSGHSLSNADDDWGRNHIRDDMRGHVIIDPSYDSTPADAWVRPGTYKHSVKTSFFFTTLNNVSGDADKKLTYCIYSATYRP